MKLPDFLVQDADGFIHVTGHRIGLEHLLHYFNQGHTAEMLQCDYPTLDLSTIYRVLAFYLDNRAVVDDYLRESESEIESQRANAVSGPGLAELRDRLAVARPAND